MSRCDPGRLFRQVRRANGGAAEPTTMLRVGGVTYTGDGIPEAWAGYFGELALPNEDTTFDPLFIQYIQEQLEFIRSLPLGDFILFTADEVAEVIQTLKLNKAAGPDDVDPKHLRFGGHELVKVLTLLFNAMTLSSHIPPAFQYGLVIPLPKGRLSALKDCLQSNFV